MDLEEPGGNLQGEEMPSEPIVLVFCCNWCSYAAADLAGTARMQYPFNVRIIRVMCTGMVHPNLVIEAFTRGAGAVMIMGCHPGECRYLEGNLKAEARLGVVESAIEAMGLERERFAVVWCSSAEADRFADAVRKMAGTARELGPTPFAEHPRS